MNLGRAFRHLFTTSAQVSRAFPSRTLQAIESAIGTCELGHSGDIRFAVEAALDCAGLWQGQTARERALEVFSLLRVWDTERNNGVLIYVLLADRDVEIVADRGIHARVGEAQWQTICQNIETAFRQGSYEEGALAGIQAVSRCLARHFPAGNESSNELPDRPVLL